MITKLTEQKGCIIAEFIDLKRFTLAVTEEVKSELKPILSQEGNKMIFDFKNIEFIDSSGIGCIISLVKTAKSNHSEIKLCNISSEVMDVLELLHLPMILDIEPENCLSGKFSIGESRVRHHNKQGLPVRQFISPL